MNGVGARQILREIKQSVDELIFKSQAGGDVENRFNLHIDTDILADAQDLLEGLTVDTDQGKDNEQRVLGLHDHRD